MKAESLEEVFDNTDKKILEEVAETLNKYSNDFGLTNKDRMAHFLGQIGAETGGLKSLSEGENYTPRRIVELYWYPKYGHLYQGYNSNLTQCLGVRYESDGGTLGDGKPPIPNPALPYKTKSEIYQAYGHPTTGINTSNLRQKITDKFYNNGNLKVKQQYINSGSLFDVVYSCRNGNRGIGSKDGSAFKGVGFIHLTGRWTYKKVSEQWNKDPKNKNNQKKFHELKENGGHLEELKTNIEVALRASMYYWDWKTYPDENGKKRNANYYADKNDIDTLSRLINGGKNGLDLREEYYDKAKEKL